MDGRLASRRPHQRLTARLVSALSERSEFDRPERSEFERDEVRGIDKGLKRLVHRARWRCISIPCAQGYAVVTRRSFDDVGELGMVMEVRITLVPLVRPHKHLVVPISGSDYSSDRSPGAPGRPLSFVGKGKIKVKVKVKGIEWLIECNPSVEVDSVNLTS